MNKKTFFNANSLAILFVLNSTLQGADSRNRLISRPTLVFDKEENRAREKARLTAELEEQPDGSFHNPVTDEYFYDYTRVVESKLLDAEEQRDRILRDEQHRWSGAAAGTLTGVVVGSRLVSKTQLSPVMTIATYGVGGGAVGFCAVKGGQIARDHFTKLSRYEKEQVFKGIETAGGAAAVASLISWKQNGLKHPATIALATGSLTCHVVTEKKDFILQTF